MRLPRRFRDEIVAHAREGREQNAEICGVLLGNDGAVTELVRVNNVAETPRVHYLMDPPGLYQVMCRQDEAGLDLLAIYHSHPHSRAYPSETDRGNAHDDEGRAWWPDVTYLICSLEYPDQPDLRAFRLFPDHSEDVQFEVV